MIIVGDPHSNNTQKLASIAAETKDVCMIESINDLDISILNGKQKVAVSSGASTPTYLTNQIIEFISQYDEHNVHTHTKPDIDYTKILF